MRKFIILMMIIAVLAGSMSGCGSTSAGKSLFNEKTLKTSGLDFGGLKMPLSETGEQITWAVTSDVTTLNDSYVVKKLRELTGVNLKLDIMTPSTAEEKTKILIASNGLRSGVSRCFGMC